MENIHADLYSQLYVSHADGGKKFLRKHTTALVVITALQVCIRSTLLSNHPDASTLFF